MGCFYHRISDNFELYLGRDRIIYNVNYSENKSNNNMINDDYNKKINDLNEEKESQKKEITINNKELKENNNINKITNTDLKESFEKHNLNEKKNIIENKTVDSKIINENDDNTQILISVNKDEYETVLITSSSKIFTDSDFINNSTDSDKDDIISLGINLGSVKTVYSLFKRENGKYISHVFLMNNSSRIIPSILCYTKTHRLFGENCISSLKQNLDSSFFNLSRIIGFNNNIQFYGNEINFEYNLNDDIKNHKFYSKGINGIQEIESEYIIANYLGLINKYFFKIEKKEYTSTYLSLPDYYTLYQKETLKLICKSLNMKDINIVNESSSITMYYGYTKYRDNFVKDKDKVDTTIIKHILFIDSGYSKTNFILSKFKYNKFEVKYVKCLPNLGGRNFDDLILKHCIREFIKNKNIDENNFKVTPKMKYRLNEVIKKARIQLTVNIETTILVESFYNNEDLEIILTKKKFEELIQNYINEIKISINDVIKYSKENYINIDCCEIAGELMRTPILQKIIEDYKIKISKSLLIDECTSVGAAILGNYIKGKLPIANYKKFNHYNYYKIEYQILNYNNYQTKKKVLFDIGTIENNEKLIKLKKEYLKEDKPIRIKFFYNKDANNNNIHLFINEFNLIEYEIDLFNVFENNKDILGNNFPYFKIKLDDSQGLIDEQLVFENYKLEGNIKIIKNGIYKLNKEKKNIILKIYKIMKESKSYDLIYHNYVDKKNQISKLIYGMKGKIEKNNEFNDELNHLILLDKKIHNIKDTNDINKENEKLSNIDEELKQISYKIIEKLLEGNNTNLFQILNKMKNELENEPNNYDINELIDIL